MQGKLLASLAMFALVACASTPRTQTHFGPRRMSALPISGLPSVATFAWVEPGRAFAGIDAERDDALHPLTADLRLSAATVLRANGWRAVPADSAEFLLSMVRVELSEQVTVMTPDPRNDRPSQRPRRCDTTRTPAPPNSQTPRQPTSEPPCTNQPPGEYPPIRSTQLVTRRTVGYSMQRVADGASRQWVLSDRRGTEMGNHIARVTLDLLLAEAK